MSDQPPRRDQDWEETQVQLREKIGSKMTVATFLAGFTFAALLELLRDSEQLSSVAIQIAVITLTLALALFVAAVYMYDRLNMPRKFWTYQDPSPRSVASSSGVNNPAPQAATDSKDAPAPDSKTEEGNRVKLIIEKLHFKVHDEEGMKVEGALYTYMIAVWTWVFTPAVIAALVGFSAILYSTHNKTIFRSGMIVIIVVMIYYVVLRPILGKYD